MTLDLDQADLAQIHAVMQTDKGELRFEFFADKAPKTVQNFMRLVQDGFYDGLIFHRVIKDFMVQSGCPNGSGTGGPGYTIDAEFNDTEHRRGVISMARARDPNSAGSQFFIVHAEHAPHLDGQYTAFGRLLEGEDVLDAIAAAPCEHSSTGELSVPEEPVRIHSVRLVPVGSAAGVGDTDGDMTAGDASPAEAPAAGDGDEGHGEGDGDD